MDVKLRAGKYMIPATIWQESDRLFLKFGFNRTLLEEVKSMEGAKWHGYEQPTPRKVWSIKRSPRNLFQLDYLQGKNPYARYDAPLVEYKSARPLYKHQIEMVQHALTRHGCVFAAEMGCVVGHTIIDTNKGYMPIRQAHNDVTVIKVAAYCDDKVRLNPSLKIKLHQVHSIVAKGIKDVISITTSQGRVLTLTPDHEVCLDGANYKAAGELSIGDDVYSVNGYERIVWIEDAGKQEVFDIVCADPHRNFVANGIVVHNCGKTLSAIEVMEQFPDKLWYWIGPKAALRAAREQLEHWKSKVMPEIMTYDALVKLMASWPKGKKAPFGVIFDESSKLKNPTTQRSQAALALAQGIREDWGDEGFVIEMSGSPAPKSPADWWHQCEVARPGFLKEGTFMKFKQRMAVIVSREGITGGAYPHLVTWRDSENKCNVCGEGRDAVSHSAGFAETWHPFVPGVNEVTKLYERMKGLVLVKFKKDCLDLPDKVYLTLRATPTRSMLSAAKLITAKSPTVVQGLTQLRELSDGFQYKEIECGEKDCITCIDGIIKEKYDPENPETALSQTAIDLNRIATRDATCHMCNGSGKTKIYKREAKQVACPKEDLLRDCLEKQEDVGRIVIYAGFTGSIDRCIDICKSEEWSTIRVDGRGWSGSSDLPVGDQALYHLFQKEVTRYPRVAFIGQPGAAGMGLTLTAANTIVFYSNDFNAESRIQAEDRCHRPGMDLNRGATIIDLVHLPTDDKVIENLKRKRELQSMSMGEFARAIAEAEVNDEREY